MEDFEKVEQPSVEAETDEEIKDNIQQANETYVDGEALNTALESENQADKTVNEKKNKKIQTPIIIAACIFIVAILAGAAYFFFFNNSIVGTWVEAPTATGDEAATQNNSDIRYFTFNNDGTASISLGSLELRGTWSYANDDSSTTDQQSNKVSISISYIVVGTFDVDIEGNAITGRTLTLTSNGNSVKFNSANKVVPEIKVDKKFKPNKKITGKWNDAKDNLTYTFNEDGTCELDQMGQLIVKGTYTIDTKKNNIVISYVDQSKKTMDCNYVTGNDSNKITFSGYEFERVKE